MFSLIWWISPEKIRNVNTHICSLSLFKYLDYIRNTSMLNIKEEISGRFFLKPFKNSSFFVVPCKLFNLTTCSSYFIFSLSKLILIVFIEICPYNLFCLLFCYLLLSKLTHKIVTTVSSFYNYFKLYYLIWCETLKVVYRYIYCVCCLHKKLNRFARMEIIPCENVA